MISKKFSLLLFSIIVIASCSTNDESNPEEEDTSNEVSIKNDISVLANVEREYYQIDIENASDVGAAINLSDELGLPTDNYGLKIDEDLVTFYRRATQSIWQKKLNNGSIFVKDPLCSVNPDESIVLISNSLNKRLTVSGKFNSVAGKFDHFLNLYDSNLDDCTQIPVNFELVRETINNDDFAIIYGRLSEEESYDLGIVDLNSNELLYILNFDRKFRGATFKDGDLMVFFLDGSYTYTLYDIRTKQIKGTGNTKGYDLIGFQNRLFQTQFNGNKMLFDITYPQPAVVGVGPAIYNLESDEVIGDDFFMFEVRKNLIDYPEADFLDFTTNEVDMENELIIAGYIRSNERGKGGVVYTNFDAEILKVVKIDYIPERIVLRGRN